MATPPPNNVAALARVLKIPEPALRQLAEHPPYIRWLVSKRGGGKREIAAPIPKLKATLRKVLRHWTADLPLHDAAHGCRPGRSIVTNASPHAGARVVVKLDVWHFFPSIEVDRVEAVLLHAGHSPDVARLLAMLCTAKPRRGTRSLPQGAPTSPSLANAACIDLDDEIDYEAHRAGARYTRYVDDLTLSLEDEHRAARLVADVADVVRRHGLKVHPGKTEIAGANDQQTVTGLVVNGARPRPSRAYRRRLRAAIHQARPADLPKLRGMAAFVMMADPDAGRRFFEQIDAAARRERTPR